MRLYVLGFTLLCGLLSCSRLGARSRLLPIRQPCTNPNNPECPPYPPPTCNFIANNDWSIPFQYKNLATDILPTIRTHYRRHNSSYPTYTFPLTFLWESLGIGGLMDDPNPKLDCCHRDIVFTRDPHKPIVATFVWTGNPVTVDSKSNPLIKDWHLTLTIPGHLTGSTTVAAGFTEFRFYSDLPHIKITYKGTDVVYDDDIQCMKGSVTSVCG